MCKLSLNYETKSEKEQICSGCKIKSVKNCYECDMQLKRYEAECSECKIIIPAKNIVAKITH